MTEQGTGLGGKVAGEGIGSGAGKPPSSTSTALTTGAASAANVMSKPVPMKLFSTWEVEKSTPSCVPRQCSLTLSRLVIMKALEHELHSVTIAMKMQSSKLVLRSNEIVLPPTGVLDVELELSFALLYPHFLKRDGNLLQVTLQRRKKYKNRTMLGFKTLASGHVNMSQVLQHPTDLEVPLYMGTKEHGKAVAFVMMMSLCSQPVDHENQSHMMTTDADRSPGEVSEEEYVRDDQDDSSNEDLSDVENLAGDEEHRVHMRKSQPLSSALASRQRNLKQKFVSLLRRFKVNDEALESAVDDLNGHDANPSRFVEELFEEVENLSDDSDLDIDTISVQSTPKPRLKPFFTPQTTSHSNLKPEKSPSHEVDRVSEENNSRTSDSDSSQQRHGVHSWPAHNCQLGQNAGQPRRAMLDQLVTILSSENVLPDCVVLINNQDCQGPFQILAQAIQSSKHHTLCTYSSVDVRAVLSATVNRIQKYCCKKSATVLTKIAVIGSDGYVSAVLKCYVELMSSKSPEWLTYLRFLFVPFGNSLISKALATLDAKYGLLFNDSFWKDNISEKSDGFSHVSQSTDISETVSRINRYLSGANHLVHLPLAEAILANKDKGSDDTSQLIVPFIGEVRLGPTDVSSSSLLGGLTDNDETSGGTSGGLSSSPPHSNPPLPNEKPKDTSANPASVSQHSAPPPSSHAGPGPSAEPAQQTSSASEAVDLQIDYWLMPSKAETSEKEKGERLAKKELKYSLKMMFRSMQVFRPLQQPGQQQQQQSIQPHGTDGGLSMIVVTREKKQKMMRIGKKSKELDPSKSQQIDGISRLICTSKSQNHPLSVTIDGVDWTGVKFFQVSAQWQTHIKHFPVLLFSSSSELMSSF